MWGKTDEKGIIDKSIDRHPQNRTIFTTVNNGGRSSYTSYKLNYYCPPLSYLSIYPQTGRTHQIRVHSSHIGHPIIGDPIYGGGIRRARQINLNEKILTKIKSLNGQALHAKTLAFKHPVHQNILNFDSRIPGELVELMDILAKI